MDFKLFGCILLIVGTSIGAGMLALPIATAQLGFVGSLILLFGCWLIMTTGAFLLLEVNLWMPTNSNINTMAKATIGPIGQIISWFAFLLLLYSLLCAYIGGGSDLFHHLLLAAGIDVPLWSASIAFTLLFGGVVYMGIKTVDYVNRGLMFVKFGAYLLLVILLMPSVAKVNLAAGNFQYLTSATAIMVTMTSFGYAAIVPSLRIYFAGDIVKLKKAIFIGSLIPLICYIVWDFVIMGVLPFEGEHSLNAILHSKSSTSDMVKALSLVVSQNSVTFFAQLFTSICVLTSFLGVALCLTDFWADGLRLAKKGPGNLIIAAVTFLPPLIIVLFIPGVFVQALQYAGIDCIVLLVFLPAWMAWMGRYKRQLKKGFTVPGGKVLLASLLIISIMLVVIGLLGK